MTRNDPTANKADDARSVAESFLPLTPLSFEVLLAMADGPRHGYGILQEIESRTGGPMKSSTGTLYLAIQRLQRDALIDAVPGEESSRRRAYALTELGQLVVKAEAERLAELVSAARGKSVLSAATPLAGDSRGSSR